MKTLEKCHQWHHERHAFNLAIYLAIQKAKCQINGRSVTCSRALYCTQLQPFLSLLSPFLNSSPDMSSWSSSSEEFIWLSPGHQALLLFVVLYAAMISVRLHVPVLRVHYHDWLYVQGEEWPTFPLGSACFMSELLVWPKCSGQEKQFIF